MDASERWEKLNNQPLDSGGQSDVYIVRDKDRFNKEQTYDDLEKSIGGLAAVGQTQEDQRRRVEKIIEAVGRINIWDDPSSWGALKVLKEFGARDAARAKARMQLEIEVIQKLSHPNLIEILDFDPEYNWYVMKYYKRGTLAKNRGNYTGNFQHTFKDFCLLLNGVAHIHNEGLVHRDIKPDNIFIDDDGTLVLGDFGLVYKLDESGERLSGTYENLGTHAWMPPWNMEGREEPSPAFDVFSLGKVLWWMISGKGSLRLWYFDRDQNNLEEIFPGDSLMKLVNNMLAKCVVEEEEACLLNASQLLGEVHNCMSLVCRKCGQGPYEMLPDYVQGLMDNGLILEACSNCGDIHIDGGTVVSKVIEDTRFTARHNPDKRQGAEWRYVDTKGRKLTNLSFKVESNSSYWRAGFMIGEPNPLSLQPLPLHAGSMLFHVGMNDGSYGITAWEGDARTVDEAMPLTDDGSISISYTYDNSNGLNCVVNGKTFPFPNANPLLLNRVVLLAWGDGNEYVVDFRDIETNSKFGLLDKLVVP